MRHTPFLWPGLLLGALSIAAPASARPAFLSSIPNAHHQECATCHISTSQDTPAWNAFGLDVLGSLVDGAPNWPAIAALDSDCDGQTNGEELGDPCGAFRTGDPTAPRLDGLGAPGDSSVLATTPDLPACTPHLKAPACTSAPAGGLTIGAAIPPAPSRPTQAPQENPGATVPASGNGGCTDSAQPPGPLPLVLAVLALAFRRARAAQAGP